MSSWMSNWYNIYKKRKNLIFWSWYWSEAIEGIILKNEVPFPHVLQPKSIGSNKIEPTFYAHIIARRTHFGFSNYYSSSSCKNLKIIQSSLTLVTMMQKKVVEGRMCCRCFDILPSSLSPPTLNSRAKIEYSVFIISF